MPLQKLSDDQPASSVVSGVARWGNLMIVALLLLLIGTFASLWLWGASQTYWHLIGAFGFHMAPFPFLDTYTELTWLECSRRGVDIFRSNPCDNYTHFTMNYPPILILGAKTGLGIGATPWVGCIKCLAFLGGLAILPATRSCSELIIRCAASLSPIVVFALERGQSELLIFSATALGCALLMRQGRVRYLGYVAFFFAAMIKFYPVTLVISSAREPIWRCFLIMGAFAAAATGALLIHSDGLPFVLRHLPPAGPFSGAFGMSNFADGLASLGPSYFVAWPWLKSAITLAWVLTVVVAVIGFLRNRDLRKAIRNITDDAALSGYAGGILTLTVSLATVSVAYRGIEFLLLLPALCQLAPLLQNRSARIGICFTLGVTLFVFWSDPIREALGLYSAAHLTTVQFLFWLLHEAAWWWLFVTAGVIVSAISMDFRSFETLNLLTNRFLFPPSLERKT
jgi:hypothetical protein